MEGFWSYVWQTLIENKFSNVDEFEKTRLFNGGKQHHLDIDLRRSDDETSSTGLGEEGDIKYYDPFWKKVRLILLVAFLMGLAFLIVAFATIVLSPKRPYRPDLKWYDKNTMYEILPESFQDSSSKKFYTIKGDGVGDLKGIYFYWLLFSCW